MNLDNIKKPTLLVDKAKAIKNIRLMKQKAEASQVIFRPHFKTHQSAIVGEWHRSEGVSKITVSSVSMAKYFVLHGWKDITIAFPLNIREFTDIERLAKSIKLNVVISSEVHADFISKNNNSPIGVFIKIDTGYHRAGLQITETQTINKIIRKLKTNKYTSFDGFIAHFGNTYLAKDEDEVRKIYQSSVYLLNQLKAEYFHDNPDLLISIGDTPSCSVLEQFENIDEIRPGNFVYYDLTQKNLGSCLEEQIAVAVACPVIDMNLIRNEILIYGGAVHLSKEYIIDILNNKSFGSIVTLHKTGWGKSIPNAYLKSISQEHGIVSIPKSSLENFKIGDLIGVLPVHSCLSADLLKEIVVLE